MKGQLCSKLRVVDKVPPAIGWLNEEHKVDCPCSGSVCGWVYGFPNTTGLQTLQAAFSQVEFVQANLVNPASAEKVFACDDAAPFDLVYNLATETKYSQSDEVSWQHSAVMECVCMCVCVCVYMCVCAGVQGEGD